ncbi:GNAT family N-acetyltransferase [Oricola sp.]|uniref:GNAT family N-acetyltransferase n=1 Tax=Oricola sp. TaxID=1979950 RepID=UPI003BABA5D3
MPPDPDIRFMPVTAADLPVLRAWLESPHMREWWGDADTELGYISDMLEGRDTTRPFIFHVDGERLGYIQYWIIGDAIAAGFQDKEPWLADLPAEAIGVDLSIGDPARLSKGVGTAVLTAFLRRLAGEGFQTIIIDPDEANGRAVRAYEKAGFVAYDRHIDKDGVTLLMRLPPERIEELKK